MDITERLTKVFRNVFQDDSIVLTPQLTADDVEGWDSLSHVNLIIAVEIEFGIEFSQAEIRGFENVGALMAAIQKKLAT
ncbi:MAG TPA: acyl carrier protein [Anaerolineaceae bacterium]|nr:acyl carrier protein [Anaerolineaceae bacterium]